MSFTTEEEWKAAFAAAEDVLQLYCQTSGSTLSPLDVGPLARQLATAVIRSQYYDGDDIALQPDVDVEQVQTRDPLVKNVATSLGSGWGYYYR